MFFHFIFINVVVVHIHKAGYIFSSKKKKKKKNFYALRFVYLIIHIMVVYVTIVEGMVGGFNFI